MKRTIRPINLSSKIDVQIRFFRQYGPPEYAVLAEKYLRAQNDWARGQFDHHFDNARTAEYLGPALSGFHWAQTFEKAVFNMRFGLQYVNLQTVKCESLVLLSGPKPLAESMPEALWKYAIFFDGREIGRLGVNFHQEENGETVASIANVQGKDGGPFAEYKKLNGRRLHWAFEAIVGLVSQLRKQVDVIRGISSLSHPSRDVPHPPGEKAFNPESAFHLYDHNFSKSCLSMERKVDHAGRTIYEWVK